MFSILFNAARRYCSRIELEFEFPGRTSWNGLTLMSCVTRRFDFENTSQMKKWKCKNACKTWNFELIFSKERILSAADSRLRAFSVRPPLSLSLSLFSFHTLENLLRRWEQSTDRYEKQKTCSTRWKSQALRKQHFLWNNLALTAQKVAIRDTALLTFGGDL